MQVLSTEAQKQIDELAASLSKDPEVVKALKQMGKALVNGVNMAAGEAAGGMMNATSVEQIKSSLKNAAGELALSGADATGMGLGLAIKKAMDHMGLPVTTIDAKLSLNPMASSVLIADGKLSDHTNPPFSSPDDSHFMPMTGDADISLTVYG